MLFRSQIAAELEQGLEDYIAANKLRYKNETGKALTRKVFIEAAISEYLKKHGV